MSFRENLKKYREKAGLSQAALGAKMGLKGSIIGRYELGEATPKPDRILDFAYALNTTPNKLLGFQEMNIEPIQYAKKYCYGFDSNFKVKKNMVEYRYFLDDIQSITDPDIDKVTMKIPLKTFIFFIEMARENTELQTSDIVENEKKKLFTRELIGKIVTHYVREKENLLKK